MSSVSGVQYKVHGEFVVFLCAEADNTTKTHLMCCVENVFAFTCELCIFEFLVDANGGIEETFKVVIKLRNL